LYTRYYKKQFPYNFTAAWTRAASGRRTHRIREVQHPEVFDETFKRIAERDIFTGTGIGQSGLNDTSRSAAQNKIGLPLFEEGRKLKRQRLAP
jgi:hypothetical protein